MQADGLILGTLTGSPAYALLHGGSVVHPSVPSLLLTPICPTTLPFQLVVLPTSATLNMQRQ